MVEQETFAIIRRVDTDGDGVLTFDEFQDFFTNQVNQEAAMVGPSQHQSSPQMSNRKPKNTARQKSELMEHVDNGRNPGKRKSAKSAAKGKVLSP